MNRKAKDRGSDKFDYVTFGVCFVIGSILAFVFSEYAALFIALGLVFGLKLPVKLSRWIRR